MLNQQQNWERRKAELLSKDSLTWGSVKLVWSGGSETYTGWISQQKIQEMMLGKENCQCHLYGELAEEVK